MLFANARKEKSVGAARLAASMGSNYARPMRAVLIRRAAPDGPVTPQVESVQDWPEPAAPGAGEVTLRTEYSALNRMDIWVGRGIPGVEIQYPHVSGCDVAAVVEEIGAGVDAAWIGRRVALNAATVVPPRDRPDDPTAATLAPNYELIGEHSHGTHRERFVALTSQLVDIGDVDGVQAAAFGLTALTAYGMMLGKGQLRPGQSVLITGIGGGVATSAFALARYFGCPTVVTSRHRWKLEKAAELGANHVILDEGQDWSKELRALTSKRGVDMVVDTIGRAVHLSCIKSLARGGAFVSAGATSGPRAETDLARLFWNQLRLLGSTMGSIDEFREVMALLRARKVEAVIDSVFSWDEAPKAWARLESEEQMGKIVLRW